MHAVLTFRLDAPNLVMLGLVLAIALVILSYSRRSLAGDPRLPGYLGWFGLTVTGVALLVTTNHLLLLAVAGSATLLAGPLDPPAGPIAPTYKTLTEVEPRTAINASNTPGDIDSLFKITQPGSYYLTGNIQSVVGTHAIEICNDNVTMDCNGLIGSNLRTYNGLGGASAKQNRRHWFQ